MTQVDSSQKEHIWKRVDPLAFFFFNLFIIFFLEYVVQFIYLFLQFRESEKGSIIPGLPDDLGLRCLAKMSHGHHGLLETVSKRWRDLICSSGYATFKAREGWCGDWLFVPSHNAGICKKKRRLTSCEGRCPRREKNR